MKLRLLIPLLLSVVLFCACGDFTSQTGTPSVDETTTTEVSLSETDAPLQEEVCHHAFGDWETVKEAKEGEAGLQRRICSLCKEEETQEIPALPVHEHFYTETVYLPGCTEEGFTQKVCACGDTLTENIVEATGHQYWDWVTVFEPTTQKEGEKSRTCIGCGVIQKAPIEKLPLPAPTHQHVYTETVYGATCTKNGYSKMTCDCGEYYIIEKAQTKGHYFGDGYRVLEPGIYCGLDRQDCIVCGEIWLTTVPPSEDEIPPEEGEIDSELTSATEGSGQGEDRDEGSVPDLPLKPTVTYYCQRDSLWGEVVMGCGVMKNNGCGPTAIAMALSYYGINVTPVEVAQWLYENTIEFNHAFHGISGTGVRLGLEHYGREVVPIRSSDELRRHLEAGAVVVGCHGKGFFVSGEENSHCITMVGLNEKGKTYCYDPYTPALNGRYDVDALWAERSALEVDLRQEGVTHFALY